MFKVLSLDGGGSRGSFIVGCLTEIEQRIGEPITDYFDLIAGTSTGAVIAVLLAAGYSTSVIQDIYVNRVNEIFLKHDSYFKGILRPLSWILNPLAYYTLGISAEEYLHAKYQNHGCYNLLYDYLGDRRLSDLHAARVVIPALNLSTEETKVFKTHHLPRQHQNFDFKAIEVVLASGAAPTLFDPVKIENEGVFCDGGVWANNPGLVGYVEAAKIANTCTRDVDVKFTPSDIAILSVGTGYNLDNFVPPENGAGITWWQRRILELMFDSQSQSTCFYLERLLQERFVRIDFKLPHRAWNPLDNTSYVNELVNLGKLHATQNFDKINELFLQQKKQPFVPFDK